VKRFKIDNFIKTHPGEPFPWFRTLTDEECQELRERLAARLSLSRDVSRLDLVRAVHSTAVVIRNADAMVAGFDVAALMHTQGFNVREYVWINWYRFDKVDQMCLDKFSQHFDDIWYPGPDDIELFDNSLEWMIEIMHDGQISILRFEE